MLGEIECMTFRKAVFLFFIFVVLLSCKGLRYYKSGTNPAGVSVILQSPSYYYTNIHQPDSVGFFLVNHNSQAWTVPHWWSDLVLVGQSRFYNRELLIRPQPNDLKEQPTTIQPGDTVLLIKLPIYALLGSEKSWTYKGKNIWPPHLINAKKFYPYIYFTAEFTTQVPNQADIIKVRSEKIKVTINEFKEPVQKSKKADLSLTSDVRMYNADDKTGHLVCKINNVGDYPIQLFCDPGSVRFKLYAYNPNRTSTMFTQFVLDNGKLPISPVTINGKTSHSIIIPLEQVLFDNPPSHALYYWSWNKKNPPISPLVYGKKDMAMSVEFWFSVVVDGQEIFSNTVQLPILSSNKKTAKK